MKSYLVFFALIILTATPVFSQTVTSTFIIDANGADATIDDYNTTQNNPNEVEYNTCAWTIGGANVIWRNFLKFDLTCIPPNATIISADLNLYYAATNNYSNTTHSSLTSSNESILQRVTSHWLENSVNWNNQPSTTTTDQLIINASQTGTQDYLNLDVKNMVQAMVTTPNQNFGFLLRLTNESIYARLIFASGDNPDQSKHPKLIITYTIPETDCFTLHLDEMNEDAAIDDYNPVQNNSNEIEYNTCAWTIFGAPVIWRNCFKFDLPCDLSQANIQSAHLSLFYAAQNSYSNATHSSLSSSNESVLQQITSPWTENSVNWNIQPSTTTLDQVILQQSTLSTQDYINIDVTNMVRTMQINTALNYGFMLKLTTEVQFARLIFASGDNPDQSKHPLLEICYNKPNGINELFETSNVLIFPNPFTNEIHFKTELNLTQGTFELYNSLGEKVFSANDFSGNVITRLIPPLANGIYHYTLYERGLLLSTWNIVHLN